MFLHTKLTIIWKINTKNIRFWTKTSGFVFQQA